MTEPRTARIPAPIYAAAGAGELAYRQLRKLPAVFTELTGRAASTTTELRDRANATLRTANTTAVGLRERATTGTESEFDRLREAAVRNAAVVMAGAQSAQERALALYGSLVARGERIVGSGVVQAAETVNADIAATSTPSPAEIAETVEATPAAKRPRAAREAKAAPASTPSGKLPAKSAAKRTRPAAK